MRLRYAGVTNDLGERVRETARFEANPVLRGAEERDDLLLAAQHCVEIADSDD